MSKRPTKIIHPKPFVSADAVKPTTRQDGIIPILFSSVRQKCQTLIKCFTKRTLKDLNTSNDHIPTTDQDGYTNMKPLFTAHDGQTLYTATHTDGQRLYIVQEAPNAGTQGGYHVIWNPGQTPRELLQAAIAHDRKQDIRLTATDVPNQDIAPTTESKAYFNHDSTDAPNGLDLARAI
jgi:hypothetical protein